MFTPSLSDYACGRIRPGADPSGNFARNLSGTPRRHQPRRCGQCQRSTSHATTRPTVRHVGGGPDPRGGPGGFGGLDGWIRESVWFRSFGIFIRRSRVCQCVKSSAEALRAALENVKSAAQQGKYRAASNACTDFIKLSHHLECKAELFIGEVLEAVYGQIWRELYNYEVPADVKEELQAKMNKHLDGLLAAYDAQENLYEMLVSIRYEATSFQFGTILKYPMSKRVGPRRKVE